MSYKQRNMIVRFANSVDLDEVAHNELPHLDLLYSLNSLYDLYL